MARDLIWKTWLVDGVALEDTLNAMQQGGFTFCAFVPVPLHATTAGHVILVASRFEEEPVQKEGRVGIPVDETVWAAYHSLPLVEQQAIQVLLRGMMTRYFQQHEGDPAC